MTNPHDIDLVREGVRLDFANLMLKDKGFGATPRAVEFMTLDGVMIKCPLLSWIFEKLHLYMS